MVWSFSKLSEENIKEITDLEKEMGITLLAFSDMVKAAELTDSQLKKINDLEDKLGMSLVAVQSK